MAVTGDVDRDEVRVRVGQFIIRTRAGPFSLRHPLWPISPAIGGVRCHIARIAVMMFRTEAG